MKLTIRLPFGCRLSSAPEFVIVFVACFSFSLTKFRFITILCKMKWNLLACGIRKWFLLIDGSIDTGLCTLTNQWREKTPNNVEFWRKYRKQYEQIHGCVRCVCVCVCLSEFVEWHYNNILIPSTNTAIQISGFFFFSSSLKIFPILWHCECELWPGGILAHARACVCVCVM